jgi:hypothetical protein
VQILPFQAVLISAVLWTAPAATAQVRIDTSSPESTLTSLAELHQSWTLRQFTEFLRAALIAQLPEEVEDRASWQGGRNRWEFLEDAMAIWAGLSIEQPLVHEGPLVRGTDSVPARLRTILDRALEGRTVAEVIREGATLERAFLVALRDDRAKQHRSEIDERQRETASREATVPQRSSSRIEDFRAEIARVERRLAMLDVDTPAPRPPDAR